MKQEKTISGPPRTEESGNILVYVLGAIILMGFLILLAKGSFSPGSGIDQEDLTLKASRVQQYVGELERAVSFILSNGHSESDIRFGLPDGSSSAYGLISAGDSTAQIFHRSGGAAEYKTPPSGINNGDDWQFYGTTHIQDIGTDTAGTRRAELIAVLPNVTSDFCETINDMNDLDLTLSDDHDPSANGCINAGAGNEFTGTFTDGAGANATDGALMTYNPVRQGCIHCEAPDSLHFYHVLLQR